MPSQDRAAIGRLFDEVPELYDRVRPNYPDELFADLMAITGIHEGSSVLEVGCGTGRATRSLAGLGLSVTAVEPGTGMASLARQRLAGFDHVQVETRPSRRGTTTVGASSFCWLPRHGTGWIPLSAGPRPTAFCVGADGWP